VVDVHPDGGANTQGRLVVKLSASMDGTVVAVVESAGVLASTCVELIKACVRLGESRLDAGVGAGAVVDGVGPTGWLDKAPNRLELRLEI